jgi:hypothetical protein
MSFAGLFREAPKRLSIFAFVGIKAATFVKTCLRGNRPLPLLWCYQSSPYVSLQVKDNVREAQGTPFPEGPVFTVNFCLCGNPSASHKADF